MEKISAVVWMGEIESHMDKAFVIEAFANMGYTALDVKEMFNKNSSERANYCFVDFGDVNVAREVLIKVNNEPIPGSENKKFSLNRSEYGRSNPNKETEYSMFVGDLSPDVTDNLLLDFFRVKYPSVRAANVVKDQLGNAKGFGFVRFFDENEHSKALREMQGAKGLGKRQLRVNKASKSKGQGGAPADQPPQSMFGGNAALSNQMDPTKMPEWMHQQMQYMQQMQQYMQQCHQYAQQAAEYAGWKENSEQDMSSMNHSSSRRVKGESSPDAETFMNIVEQEHAEMMSQTAEVDEDQELVDPDPPPDVNAMNREIIETDDKLFFELEASSWDFEYSFAKASQQRLVKTR